ncbi:MAG: hypothetical protein ACRC9L_03550 [Brevinema sp.]
MKEKSRRNVRPAHSDTMGVLPLRVVGSLEGINGNAFALMGYFQKTAREQGFSKEWISTVLEEAMSKDYEHLVNTLRKHMLEV